MKDILLVEDNQELSALIATFLKKDGYSVQICESGEAAIQFLENESVKLLLLDIMLPGMDGFAVCSEVRKRQAVPIVIMSAMTDKGNQLKGYEIGADDYLEKPVDIDLLRMKIRAMMHRNYENAEANKMISCGDITIDLDAKCAYQNEKQLELNVKEYELLLLLVENAGKTLNKDYIFNQIWGVDSFSENQTLTVHIKRLRDKIEPDPKKPVHIQTVWGVGYKYEKD
ncbi:MAG: response regulator transcription factor [Lachnospira sp.]|jgi:DNA-binding response OmpR family regulator|nr:response regulator transcription factor [Lachnospira sp.]